MKRRFADARNHKNIMEKDYENYYIENTEFKGNVSVLKIKTTLKKWLVDEEERCILDNNYTWVEIYPDGENYCITVMMDENLKIKEWYFDIAKKTGVEDGVPFEDDLYLDVVIVPNGRVNILDENELESAYKNTEITEEDFYLAYKIKDYIMEKYAKNLEKLEKFTFDILKQIGLK